MKKINLDEKFGLFESVWAPKIIAESNGQLVKLAKGEGELVWHHHEKEDELFLVIKGELTLKMRSEVVVLGPGEMYVVARGVEHCPVAIEGTQFLMIEPASTAHTGAKQTERTIAQTDQPWI